MVPAGTYSAREGGHYSSPNHRQRPMAMPEGELQEEDPPNSQAAPQGTANGRGSQAHLLGYHKVLRNARTGEIVKDFGFVSPDDRDLHDKTSRIRPKSQAVEFNNDGTLRQMPQHLTQDQMNAIFDAVKAKKGIQQSRNADQPTSQNTLTPDHTLPTRLPPSPGSEADSGGEDCPESGSSKSQKEQPANGNAVFQT